MRRNIKNDKVLRAISIGLATMIAVTSTPVTAFAGEGDEGGEGGEPVAQTPSDPTPSEGSSGESTPSTPIPVENLIPDQENQSEAVQNAARNVVINEMAAQGCTSAIGGLKDQVITDVANANSAMEAASSTVAGVNGFNQVATEVESSIGLLSGDGNLIQTAENNASAQETAIGVGVTVTIPLDENGNVQKDENGNIIVNVEKNTNDLDAKVVDANGKIDTAEKGKKETYNALKKVEDASSKKEIADSDTTAVNNAKTNLDTETEKKLKDIAKKLEDAVGVIDSEGNITSAKKLGDAINAASTASTAAADLAWEKLDDVQDAFQKAQSAASEAQTHIRDYSYSQMANLATGAQSAATAAKEASDLAVTSYNTALENENTAQKALEGAQNEFVTAKKQAADVLLNYKNKIAEINSDSGLLGTANGSRSAAKTAMIEANNAIDAALKIMENVETTSTGAKTVYLAYTTAMKAVKKANEAINGITGLVYDENVSKDEKEKNSFYIAEQKQEEADRNVREQLSKLDTAFNNYKEAIKKTGTTEENRNKAAAAVKEINNLIDGIKNELDELVKKGLYDECSEDIAKEINDLKALLTSGKTYEKLEEELGNADSALTNKNKNRENVSEEDKKLTAAQLADKYDEDEKWIADNSGNVFSAMNEAKSAHGELTAEIAKMKEKYKFDDNKQEFVKDSQGNYVERDDEEYLELVKQSEERIITYKSGDDELPIENADYEEEDGTAIYKKTTKDGNKLVDGQGGKPGRMSNDCITEKEVTKRIENGKLVESAACKYEQDIKRDYITNIENGKGRGNFIYTKPESEEEAETIILKELVSERLFLKGPQELVLGKNMIVEGNKVTVTMTHDMSPNIVPDKATEVHVLEFSFSFVGDYYESKESWTYGQIIRNYSATIEEKSATRKGQYVEEDTWNYVKYDRTTGGFTDAAVSAQEKLNNANISNYENAKDNQKTKSEAYDRINADYNNKNSFISALKDEVENYKTAKENKNKADGYTGVSAETELAKVNKAKEQAKEYQSQAQAALNELDKARKKEVDAQARYNAVKKKIDDALSRLAVSGAKLSTLKQSQKDAVGKLKSKSVSEDYTPEGVNESLATLYKRLDGKLNLSTLEKFKPEDYNALAQLTGKFKSVDFGNTEKFTAEDYDIKFSADDLGKNLADALNNAAIILMTEEANLNEAIGTRKAAERLVYGVHSPKDVELDEGEEFEEVDGLVDIARKAQEEADKAAKALADWRAPEDDDDDYSGDDAGSRGPGGYSGLPGSSADVITLTPVGDYDDAGAAGGNGAGRGGRRSGAGAQDRGVAGVRVEDNSGANKSNSNLVVAKNTNDDDKDDTAQKLSKVETPETPLAATPFKEDPVNPAIVGISIASLLAVLAGLYYEYNRRRKAKAEEMKKYKKDR